MKTTKSHINGSGYGDSHTWIRRMTNQGGSGIFGGGLSSFDKATGYYCNKCRAGFSHQYDITPKIFEAIEQSGVPDKCESQTEICPCGANPKMDEGEVCKDCL